MRSDVYVDELDFDWVTSYADELEFDRVTSYANKLDFDWLIHMQMS